MFVDVIGSIHTLRNHGGGRGEWVSKMLMHDYGEMGGGVGLMMT